jgi:hypothetical protein
MAKKPNKTESIAADTESRPAGEISFRCRFCAQDKPLSDLVMLRQYYPPLAACHECFRINNNLREGF